MRVLIGAALVALLAVSCTSPYQPSPLPPSTPGNTSPPPSANPAPTVEPLIVSLSVGRGDPTVGDSISFVVSAGTAITQADWSFGNGATASTAIGETAYTYPAHGTFTARVTVTVSDGRIGSDEARVTVRPKDPPPPVPPPPPPPPPIPLVVDLTCNPQSILVSTPCSVTVSYLGTALASGLSVSWNWDEPGSPVTTTTGPDSSYPYLQAGPHTVVATVTATTTDGPRQGTGSLALTIPN